MKIILASKSPRRQELLSLMGLKFEVMPSLKEEDMTQHLKLNKLSEAADKAKNKISEIFSYKDKKTQIQKAIEATTDAIKGYTKAAVQYQRQANKIAGIAKKSTKSTSKDNLGNSIVESAKKA